MANGFGSMFIGVAGLQSSQNALNVTSNNLANLDTTGYVRQSVLFADRDYVTFNTTAAISNQQSGLGVTIGDVVHSRDVFLDRLYRTESSRQSFYASTSEALTEVQNYYQELEGQAFQDALTDFWGSFQELYKYPEDSVYQNLVIQKAQLFTSRSSAVYSGLKSYQYNINSQISDDIDQVNELGKTISELNLQIQKIEAGNIETAMTLRDARDLALDELASLVDISYKEEVNGVVRVSVEGNEFVNENGYYKVEKQTDKATGFVTPYWSHLSDPDKGEYTYLFNFNRDISTENKNDMGEIKALVLARGDKVANYKDILGVDGKTYDDTTGMSVMLRAEAQMDQLFHGIATAINDILCPNTEASNYITGLTGNNSVTMTDADGNTYTVTANTKILDADKCAVGSDGKLPPQELFTRLGTERYTEVSYTELYEAAAMDGAGRWGKMRYITFPALQNTILTVLILNLAKVMNLFESAFVMQNDAVLGTANVLETYIYYQTFNSGAIPNYGYTTAVGLFKSLVGCVLVLFCNHLSKKVRDGRGIV